MLDEPNDGDGGELYDVEPNDGDGAELYDDELYDGELYDEPNDGDGGELYDDELYNGELYDDGEFYDGEHGEPNVNAKQSANCSCDGIGYSPQRIPENNDDHRSTPKTRCLSAPEDTRETA
jgi:hypothetical protein